MRTAAEEPTWDDLTVTDTEADILESIFCYFARLGGGGGGGGGIVVNKLTGLALNPSALSKYVETIANPLIRSFPNGSIDPELIKLANMVGRQQY
jgi:hypothetical protein